MSLHNEFRDGVGSVVAGAAGCGAVCANAGDIMSQVASMIFFIVVSLNKENH
jgi:hypothetical protein